MARRHPHRIALALCLALALPGAVSAGGLYRWVTKDGRVEVGPFPPPGVHAEPWQPEDEQKPKPAESAPAGSAAPARGPTPVMTDPRPGGATRRSGGWQTAPPRAERSALEIECDEAAGKKANVTRERADTERNIERLEREIERLEETLIANESASCATNSWGYKKRAGCRDSNFNRDDALAKAQKDLEKAQSKLGDLEQKEREAAQTEEKCAKLPAAPQQ